MTVDVRPSIEQRPWFLSAEELTATRAKLAKVQARAVKKGFTGRLDLDARPATRVQHTPGGLAVTVHGFDVTISGEPPSYQGWRFIAAVDTVEGGAILRYPPGAEQVVRNQDVDPGQCDHCHTRRERRSTVLVAHEQTGQLLQVGTSCLRDFLGHDTPPVFLAADDLRSDLERGLSHTAAAWDTHSVVAYSWAAVQTFGWTPATAEAPGRRPTRDVVAAVLTQSRESGDLLKAMGEHLAEGRRRAPDIIRTLVDQLTSETGYEANLTAVLRGEAVDRRHLGLAVSAISAYQRLVERRIAEAIRAEQNAVLDYAGPVGAKVTVTGCVSTAVRVDGFHYRSPDNVLLVVDAGASIAKMVTAAAWAYQVKTGDTITVTGTVKGHTEWRGAKQTLLVRPRLQNAATTPSGDAVWERVDSPPPESLPAHRTPPAKPAIRAAVAR